MSCKGAGPYVSSWAGLPSLLSCQYCLWGRGQRGNSAIRLLALVHFPMNPHMRLGVSPTVATTAIVHSLLWVSVSHSASPTRMVRCLTAGSLRPPALVVCLFCLTLSLIPWLSESRAVWFGGTSGCLLILGWLVSSFWLCEEAKGFYLCLHLGWSLNMYF